MGLAAAATVAVTAANVSAAPGTATLTNDYRAWPTAAVAVARRRALEGHMPTQVLYGEHVEVLEHRGAWSRIVVPDQPTPLHPAGYPGWARTSCGRRADAL